jgi:hypothetical protein
MLLVVPSVHGQTQGNCLLSGSRASVLAIAGHSVVLRARADHPRGCERCHSSSTFQVLTSHHFYMVHKNTVTQARTLHGDMKQAPEFDVKNLEEEVRSHVCTSG